jgi:hypothetical protein
LSSQRECLPSLSPQDPSPEEGKDEQKEPEGQRQQQQELEEEVCEVQEISEVKPNLEELFRNVLLERSEEIKEFVARYPLPS